jgi:hypothetical protein
MNVHRILTPEILLDLAIGDFQYLMVAQLCFFINY